MIGVMILASLTATGQEKYRSLKLTLGGGYGHYFNTFTNVLDEDIKNNRPSFSAKLMWEPEYRLRIGFESGYYDLYSTTRLQTGGTSEKLTTSLGVVPLFISFSMKTLKHLDVNFATGGAVMNYSIMTNKSKSGIVKGQTLSLADFCAGITWYIPVGRRVEFGTELKYLYIGKTADHHISAFLTCSYKIVNRPLR